MHTHAYTALFHCIIVYNPQRTRVLPLVLTLFAPLQRCYAATDEIEATVVEAALGHRGWHGDGKGEGRDQEERAIIANDEVPFPACFGHVTYPHTCIPQHHAIHAQTLAVCAKG